MPSLLDDPEAYAFAAQLAEDERKKLGLQSLLGGIGGLLEAPVSYVKERATALATDPIGDMKRTMQGTIDRAKQREQLQQIAYGDPQNPTRVTDQAAADQLANEYLDMASTIMPAGMTVFHGSPYKFNAFDPTKIGSGEGAQAYGYGHYVAESPDVAKSYAVDASSNNAARTFAPRSNAIQNSIDYFEAMLKNEVSRDLKNGVAVSDDYIKSQIAQLNDQLPSVYKIDLPDDQIAKMLDWDAEISKQSKEVQDLAKQYGLNMDDLGGDLVAAMDAKRPAGAESMRQAGVPGIKYFDAQSRGGQKADTRNFVVFPKNEGLLKIEEVNGQPVQSGLLDTDYRGSHSAPNAEVYGATLDDLTKIMPADVYAPEGKQLYGLGDRLVDSEWRIAALKTRGKPDAEIEVYRAVPKGVKDINSGDWVTTSKTYADQHGERTLDGDYEIIKRKVKARTLSSEGYPYEFGYNE
jgi:hypothetical protein